LKTSLCGLVAAGLVFLSAAGAVEQADLKNIKQQISSQQQQIKQRQQQLDALQQDLKKIEQQVATTATALNRTRNKLQLNRNQLTELKQRREELLERRDQQLQRLEKQLVTAYSAGSHDYLKMLLNPGSPADLERTMSYYRYLNKARVQSLEQLQLTEAELKATGNQLQQAQAQLTEQQQQQQQQQQALAQQQAEGNRARTALNQELKTDRRQLTRLQQAEAQLTQKLEEARRRQLAEQQRQQQLRQLAGLARYQGKLDWPLAGKVLHRFGNTRGGELTWKGLLIAAAEGTPVHAIYHGQVVFADWLRGYGMVIAVDHGDDFLSLYGHNQAFLKRVGDYVEGGEPLALAGQTGGADQPSLYFEIRHRGETIDPSRWLK